MTDWLKEVTCPTCGNTWYANITEALDERELVFRDAGDHDAGTVMVAVKCPVCATRKVLTLRAKENDDA
jgi:endogenous inhibitor of DNA gyrase (YacG/DUF329 family)